MGRKQGAGSVKQGARSTKKGARSKEQGLTSKEQGTRSRQPGGGFGLRLLRGLLLATGAAAGLILGAVASTYPFGRHGWQSLGPGLGQIRWVTIARDAELSPPTASDWVVRLRERDVPWPTDLPLKHTGVTFGGNERSTAAWFLIQPERPRKELWHIDKPTVRLTDAGDHEIPWDGGSGSALAVPDAGSQLCYARLPPQALLRQGLRIRFRLATFGGEHSREVAFQLR